MENKYRALRTIGSIYKIMGLIAGVITIIIVIGVCLTSVLGGAVVNSIFNEFGGSGSSGIFSGIFGGLFINLFVILNGGGLALTLYAMGEGIDIMISLEENTRATVQLLRGEKEIPEEI